ncbi:MAG: prophage endopeptidase tail family protein [Clostridia bacterium]|jgi:hypothetical protein
MLTLYDINHNKIEGLTNYKELKVTQEINIDELLSFSYPIIDSKSSKISLEGYIQTSENEYVIKEKNIINDDWYQIICKVNLEDFKTNMEDMYYHPILSYKNWYKDSLPPYTHAYSASSTISDVFNYQELLHFMHVSNPDSYPDVTEWTLVDHTGEEFDIIFREITLGVCTLYDILLAVQTTFFVEMTFDSLNNVIHLWSPNAAPDKGVYFAEQLNLREISVQNNSYDFCTMLIPKGANGLNITGAGSISIPGRPMLRHPAGQNYLLDTTNSNKIILDFWENTNCTLVSDLMNDAAQVLISRSKLTAPSYKISIADLSKQSGYSILSYELGDIVTLLASSKGVNDKQRIVKLEKYPDEPELNQCEIASVPQSLVNMIAGR